MQTEALKTVEKMYQMTCKGLIPVVLARELSRWRDASAYCGSHGGTLLGSAVPPVQRDRGSPVMVLLCIWTTDLVPPSCIMWVPPFLAAPPLSPPSVSPLPLSSPSLYLPPPSSPPSLCLPPPSPPPSLCRPLPHYSSLIYGMKYYAAHPFFSPFLLPLPISTGRHGSMILFPWMRILLVHVQSILSFHVLSCDRLSQLGQPRLPANPSVSPAHCHQYAYMLMYEHLVPPFPLSPSSLLCGPPFVSPPSFLAAVQNSRSTLTGVCAIAQHM